MAFLAAEIGGVGAVVCGLEVVGGRVMVGAELLLEEELKIEDCLGTVVPSLFC